MCPPCTWSSTTAPALAFRPFKGNFTAPLSTCPPVTLLNRSLRSTHKTERIISSDQILWKCCHSRYSTRKLAASATMETTSASVPQIPPPWAQACPAQRGKKAWDSRIKSQTAVTVVCPVASPAQPAQTLITLWKGSELPGCHQDHKLKRSYSAARHTPVTSLWQLLHAWRLKEKSWQMKEEHERAERAEGAYDNERLL